MSDITPKAVATSAGLTPALASATPATGNTATAAEIPASVANMSVGTVVTGTVIERSPRGMVVLRTDKGTVKLQSSMPLKPGSTVTLQIQSLGAQVQLQILSVDGQPIANTPIKQPQGRVDGTVKPPQGEPTTNRPSSPSTSAAHPPQHAADDVNTAAARATPNDRLTGERNPVARGQPATSPAPAGGFVARPLAQISSLSLEALSTPPPNGPANPTARPAVAAPPGATSPATSSPPTSATPVAATPVAATPEGIAAPAKIVVGERFTASLVGQAPAGAAVPTAREGPNNPPTISNAIPSQPVAGAASTIPSPSTPPAPVSDRVILRLLGIAAIPSAAQSGNPGAASASAASPASPAIAAGVTVAADARTIIGTIAANGDKATMPPAGGNNATMPPAGGNAGGAKTWIATPLGLLSAEGSAPGPVGSKLLLELIAPGQPSDPRLSPLGRLPQSMAGAVNASDKSWPALRGLMAAIQSVAPGAAEHLAKVTLPQIGPNLAAGMMIFVGALRQGNPQAWLGEQTVDILKRSGQGALIDRLGDEMTSVTRQAAETNPQGWQSLLMPLYDGNQLQQIRMYWKRQQRKPNQTKDSTRFVIEADLTKLGTLQLDGVFNKPQFDLVVRSSSSLPAQIRGDIIEIFGDALLATSLKGAVTFQTTRDLRPGPPNDEPDSGPGLIV